MVFPFIMWLIINLGLVYFFEYVIITGLNDRITIHIKNKISHQTFWIK